MLLYETVVDYVLLVYEEVAKSQGFIKVLQCMKRSKMAICVQEAQSVQKGFKFPVNPKISRWPTMSQD